MEVHQESPLQGLGGYRVRDSETEEGGKESDVSISGVRIPPEKVQKALGRYCYESVLDTFRPRKYCRHCSNTLDHKRARADQPTIQLLSRLCWETCPYESALRLLLTQTNGHGPQTSAGSDFSQISDVSHIF